MLDNRNKLCGHTFEDIISIENILAAWREFAAGKRGKKDVQEFSYRLMDNILTLHDDLQTGAYRHGSYEAFKISDPKPRDIHKASVRDRLLHHAVYRVLYPLFDRTWISDSYSCRNQKGTHRAMNRFRTFSQKTSKNHTRTAWVLKCDIRKFFASIDHEILIQIISKTISDIRTIDLLTKLIVSFTSTGPGKGLPLGNLTSQMLVNLYMNEFDQFVKHRLKLKYYIRYADDFVVFWEDRNMLELTIPKFAVFLKDNLNLSLHPLKVSIWPIASGVDFLGWVHFPDHRIIRTSTKKRMLKRLKITSKLSVVESYKGLLQHGNSHRLSTSIALLNS